MLLSSRQLLSHVIALLLLVAVVCGALISGSEGNFTHAEKALSASAWSSLLSFPSSLSLEHSSIIAARGFLSNRPVGERNMLCATFTDHAGLDLIFANMKKLGDTCEWAVIVYEPLQQQYTSEEQAKTMIRERAPRGVKIVRIQFVEQDRRLLVNALHARTSDLSSARRIVDLLQSNNEVWQQQQQQQQQQQYNTLSYPKTLQYMYLLDLLSLYKRVWLLDSDIDLSDFDVETFLHTLQCAFEVPALVSQPLVGENTQTYKYLNEQAWAKKKDVLASETGFIEIQAPVIECAFFEWFLRFLVVPLLEPSAILGADWGIDDLFCNAAAVFASESQPAVKSSSGGACVIIVAGKPIHHLDKGGGWSGDLERQGGLSDSRAFRKRLNKHMIAITKKLFPNFHQSGHDKALDPLRSENGFQQVFKLLESNQESCQSR